jgi:hypothetical protein
VGEGSRRHRLTPIGDELKARPPVVAKPTLRRRWRARRRLLPTPKTWYGRLAVSIVKFTVGVAVAAGVVFLIADLDGWTGGKALSKVFFVVGVAMMGTISVMLFGAGPMNARRDAFYERSLGSNEKHQQVILAAVGFCLILIGVLIDASS